MITNFPAPQPFKVEEEAPVLQPIPDIFKDLPSAQLLHHHHRPHSELDEDELRHPHIPFQERLEIFRRKEATEQELHKKLGCWTYFKYSCSMSFVHFKRGLAASLAGLDVWKKTIRHIEGHFGVGVTSYFHFIKWLFFINIFVLFISISFIAVPQILFNYIGNNTNIIRNDLHPSDFFTGSGWLNNSELFYGGYFDNSITLVDWLTYSIPAAYFIASTTMFLSCFIILAYSTTSQLRDTYVKSSDEYSSSSLLSALLTGWDFGIRNEKSAKLRHKSNNFTLRELYHKLSHKGGRNCLQMIQTIALRLGINVLILALTGAACLGISYLEEDRLKGGYLQKGDPVWTSFAMPILVTALMYVLPFLFHIFASFEEYQRHFGKVIISLFRVMVLMVLMLGVLVFRWTEFIITPSDNSTSTANAPQPECWETWVGQHIYRFVIVDIIFAVAHAFFFEFLLNIFSKFVPRLTQPEFDIAGNTFRLIYSQTLCWLGQYYSPLVCLIQCIKLVFLFLVKRSTVVHGCAPPRRAWRGASADFFFTLFITISLLLDLAVVICGWIFVPPSVGCGPFAHSNSTTIVEISNLIVTNSQYGVLNAIWAFIRSRGFALFLSTLLIVFVVNVSVRSTALNDTISSLRKNISIEGKDRTYLLRTLQKYQENVAAKPANNLKRKPMRSTERLQLVRETSGRQPSEIMATSVF